MKTATPITTTEADAAMTKVVLIVLETPVCVVFGVTDCIVSGAPVCVVSAPMAEVGTI